MAGNNSIVNTGVVSVGVTPEEKRMLLNGIGMNNDQAGCYVDYADSAVSDANRPPVDGEHVAAGTVLPARGAKGPYDNYSFTPIDTKPRFLETTESERNEKGEKY